MTSHQEGRQIGYSGVAPVRRDVDVEPGVE
jgi:hypothetical protein